MSPGSRGLSVLLCLLFTLTGLVLHHPAARADETPGFIQDGQLTLCTNPTLPPMTFVNGSDTTALAGMDIDLARLLAARWHATFVPDTMDFEGMFPSLAARRCGMVISGVLRQSGREKNYDAVPYADSALVVVARAGAPKLTAMTDLSGKTIATQSGTSYAARIEKENDTLRAEGRTPIIVQQYPTEDQVVQQVLIGRVNAFISQDVELYYRQKQLGGKVSIIFKPDYPDYRQFAIYIRKNAEDRVQLQRAIDDLTSGGEIAGLEKKWGVSGEHEQVFSEKNAPARFDFATFFSALTSVAFLKGAALTLTIAVLSHMMAIVISIPIAMRLNGPDSPLKFILSAYVAVFRGAPTLLQLLFIWNALPQFLPFFREHWFTPFLATWLSLSINESAYQVEINRAALRAVDPGQRLAADALGMKSAQVYRHVIFPQALRIALPPTINEFISLLKTTSLASVISLQELLAVTQIQVARTFEFTEYYSAALIYYLAMVFFFLYLQKRIERRFAWADRNKASANVA
ncbi:ABC transporter substrate-binding protein/permease [Acetobacter oeni]|uniref:Amino acid ABC transporter permease n=1 Tax=Acetobacter oeni TaxID=304077 RepID=A0A511XHH4_9PROT|nr:ABC transporter substrate-binding protein/permease [Acetobacter oeni]MBB3881240.1 polar amino acid transport system substrate-binding protein [Acetobacter oeni]NHO18115.1 ABC transporter permease subunit [Acetobacter oeni]GBR08253.1 ABC transporter amino acid transporter permease [Acetobacter oeni LMG 21952]GEN62392.1 amino acid ABC transporter permease [Acetobacter oeni]